MLYFRKQPRQGVITRPSGSVTEVLPSYQCCNAFGTSKGTPPTRSGRLLSGLLTFNVPPFAPPFARGSTNPLCARKFPPTRQPPRSLSSTPCSVLTHFPRPTGRSYTQFTASLCGTSLVEI